VIKTSRLTKTYGRTQALTDLSFNVAPGEGLGVIGPRGSGKTTLLRVLATLIPPTSGRATIAGLDLLRDVYRVRRRVAYVGDDRPRGEGLRVGEYLDLVALARRRTASRAGGTTTIALARAGLDERLVVDELPGDGSARLALAAALAVPPDVLLLDEPLALVDPAARGSFMDWISETQDRGSTIIAAAETRAALPAHCRRIFRFDAGHLAGDA
jgi:ABC-2 type transport system ATP-binding protein